MMWSARLRIPLHGQGGASLIESLVAVAILGTAVVAFVVALSTGSIAIGVADEQVVAQRLAQAQIEFIRGRPFAARYDPFATTLPEVPKGYEIRTIVVTPAPIPGGDADIQEIRVTIRRNGEDILTVATYRVRR